jgi:hypothetical protein
MSKLTLVSNLNQPLRPLVEAALTNELRLIEAGIYRTEQRLKQFEQMYRMSTAEFVSRYETDESPEKLAYAEWIGERRLLARLHEKADTLQEVQFAN